ncbi:MAG TPA: glycosyltransferase family 4 protein [Chitinophagaceae bacterium]|nr:glycosyltransferase family 4 protein [Chitinophagaceae bacterium]
MKPKLIRVTTVPIALKYLLAGQMRYMRENGFDVLMVSADGTGRREVIEQEGCPHVVVPMTRKITPFQDLRSLWRMYRLFRKEKPDIVHSHTPKAGLVAMLAARCAGVKIRIHTIAGLRFMTATGWKKKLLMRMEKLTARQATHVWPNSYSLLQYIREQRLVRSEKLDVIGGGSSNGINLDRFSPATIDQQKLLEIKKALNYDDALVYLLCVGRIVRDKGIDELLWAFLRLYESDPRLRLILVGSREDELDPVSEESKRLLNTHPGIILTGWRDDVEYFMSISSALVHPSYREGFPNVLLQAGAMICPVICSRIEGNVDVVEHRVTGLLFEPRDGQALLACLEEALRNPAALQAYAASLRKKIGEKFDQKVIQRQLLVRYRQLLEKTGSRS